MKLKEIRTKGFYTDGTFVYYNCNGKKDGRFIVFTERHEGSEWFLKSGVSTAYARCEDREKEVRLVEAGEKFFNGDIEVIDAKNLKVYTVLYNNRKYDNKGYTINTNEIEYVETTRIINLEKAQKGIL